MFDSFVEGLLKRISNVTAGGFGDNIDSSIVDLQGAESCEFDVLFGAIAATGTATMIIQHGNDAALADAAAVTGASVAVIDTDDNKIARLLIHKPLKRYARIRVSRATANVAIDGMTALLHNRKVVAVTQDSTVIATSKEVAVV